MKRSDRFCYAELADDLRAQIKAGFIRPGDYLLPESELCVKYGISRASVRRALIDLQNERLIVKQPGRGTLVLESEPDPQAIKEELVIVSPAPSMFGSKLLPPLIRLFEERCPQVRVKCVTLPYRESLLDELKMLGVRADLFVVSDHQFRFMKPDDFYPIPTSVVQQSYIPAPILDAFIQNEGLLAAPVTYSPVFLAYHKTLFQQHQVELPTANWTIQQFMDTAKRLTMDTNNDGRIDLYGLALSSSTTRWPVFALKQGAEVIDSTASDASYRSWLDALTMMQDLIYRQNAVPIFPIHDILLIQQLFEEGRIAMMLTSLLALSKRDEPVPCEIAPFPVGYDRGGLLIANGLMVPRQSANPHLAQLFIELCLDPEAQHAMIGQGRFLSVYDDVNRRQWSNQDLHALGVLPEQIVRSKCFGHLFPQDIRLNELEDMMKKYWIGMESPEQLVHRLHSR
ncbi:extracellular solute-binding protein [Paenibacillus koleovorans]|uniref:extracellular solute-binding protein n=1 Tax=Paenibacillus koleovorans TaxID=121608 RepID=UPI000FD87C4E|nr:extracellular solute-binding protein [Paenibacillus koleovorans]